MNLCAARLAVLVTGLAALLGGCVAAGTARQQAAVPTVAPELTPGVAPGIDTDEAGLWLQFEKVERSLGASGRVVRDPALQAYVGDIICRLSPEHCADIRLYIVRTPHFNATMAPNGYMEVWTGLILRADNEAQLAYVLGHELGHYLHRHSLKRWRDLRGKLDAAAFLSLAAGAAGVGVVAGTAVQLAVVGSVFAFSRDQEREADEVGFALVRQAGYDPREAARIWQDLEAERKAGDEDTPGIFFASHPPTEERIETLQAHAVDSTGGESGRERHATVTAGMRIQWLEDELSRRHYAGSLVLLDRLQAGNPGDADLLAFRGEVHRLRNEDGDDEIALAAFEQALDGGTSVDAIHRSQALVLWRVGRRAEAASAFRRYLATTPQASDAAMIRSYIEQLEGA